MAQENYQGGATPTTGNGNIQRQESDSEERDTASLDEVGKGILYYIAQFWAELDIKQMLWQTVVNSFWPPATIEAICKQFSDLWNDDWATTVDSLYAPRNFLDDPLGCLHDIWSNFLILLDFPLSLWRTLNHVAGLLIGYVTILVVLVEAILGGIAAAEVGVVPGLLAGAGAGLATMAPIAEGLIASYLLAESSTVIIILVRLFTARQTCEKRQVDISTSVASFIAMAVALVLQVLMALLAELVNLIASVLKGAPKPAPQPQPQPVAPPAQPGLPPPTPSPIPASPQPQPVPVQPTVPAQPAAPVIPLRPRPATPAEPGRIAAKFEDGVSQARFPEPGNNKSSAELADNSDTMQEANPENGSIALSGMQDAENGIIQTARKDKTDPDACKEEEENQMRVQLQEGDNHHADAVRKNKPKQGVTVAQLRNALHELFSKGRGKIPSRFESAFLGAIARSSQAYGKYPPGGVDRGGNFHREKFPDEQDGPFRVDSENLRGINLRE